MCSDFISFDTLGVDYEIDQVPVDEDEDNTLINVKPLENSVNNTSDDSSCRIRIPCTSYISDLYNIRHDLSIDEHNLYRKLTLDLRKFLLDSIINDDFCVSCRRGSDDVIPSAVDGNTIGDYIDDTADSDSLPSRHDTLEMIPENASSISSDGNLTSDVSGSDSLISFTDETQMHMELNDYNLKGDDDIELEILPRQLNRIITEMAHVQMRTFYSSYPRAFKISYGNVSSEVYTLGRRFYIGNDDIGSNNVKYNPTSHLVYLARLYRRQRTICYYCGYPECSRTISSRNPCDYQVCIKCTGTHSWSTKSCNANGSKLDKLLSANDWRLTRTNLWKSQPKEVKECFKCFYCNNEGEANYKCQGISCPSGYNTLNSRCLELVGSNEIKRSIRTNSKLYPQLKRHPFVFN